MADSAWTWTCTDFQTRFARALSGVKSDKKQRQGWSCLLSLARTLVFLLSSHGRKMTKKKQKFWRLNKQSKPMRDFTLRWDSLSCCFRLHSSRFSPVLPPLPLAHCGSGKVVSSLRGARELSLLAIALYAQTLTLLPALSPPPCRTTFITHSFVFGQHRAAVILSNFGHSLWPAAALSLSPLSTQSFKPR